MQVPFFRDNLRAHGSNQGSPFSGHAWQERIILRKVITPAVIQNPTNKHCRPRFFGHELKIHFRLRLLYLWVWIWSSGLFGYSLILAFCNVNESSSISSSNWLICAKWSRFPHQNTSASFSDCDELVNTSPVPDTQIACRALQKYKFIETASYQRPFASNDSSSLTIPPSWQQYRHPNGDIYYYNPLLRLITPEDIRDPAMLEFVLDAREDHIQCLQDDSSISNLPDDWELTLSDVTDSSAVIGMHSRKMGLSYEWAEDKGLEIMNPEHFWSHVAEYPSHHEDLPPNTEAAFIQALTDAKISLDNGSTLPFTTSQIDQMIQRYQVLKALQAEGKAVVPALAWLMGVVMPLEAYEGAYTDETLQELMERLRF